MRPQQITTNENSIQKAPRPDNNKHPLSSGHKNWAVSETAVLTAAGLRDQSPVRAMDRVLIGLKRVHLQAPVNTVYRRLRREKECSITYDITLVVVGRLCVCGSG